MLLLSQDYDIILKWHIQVTHCVIQVTYYFQVTYCSYSSNILCYLSYYYATSKSEEVLHGTVVPKTTNYFTIICWTAIPTVFLKFQFSLNNRHTIWVYLLLVIKTRKTPAQTQPGREKKRFNIINVLSRACTHIIICYLWMLMNIRSSHTKALEFFNTMFALNK